MKRLYFDRLTVVSHKERAARVLSFNRNATILKGKNDVGKSSLIKTIFKTLGTEPHKETEEWKDAAVQSVVDFDIAGTKYSILRSKSSYGLFDASDRLLESFVSVSTGLGPKLADLFDFHLALESKNSEATQATPAFLFLPFYADQDKSWVTPLDGFQRLQQFQNYRRDVVFFHAGIQPNEYYQAKSEQMEAERKQNEEKQGRDAVVYAIRTVDRLFAGNDFAVSVDDFKQEIDSLLKQSETLRSEEAQLKNRMVELRNRQIAIESQLGIYAHAADELEKDFQYAAVELDDSVECPTCGAHYENSIAERFGIAVDENRCRELVEELQTERDDLKAEYDKTIGELDSTAAQVREVDELLAVRKGEMSFRDILQSEGKREVRTALQDDLNQVNLRIGALELTIDDTKARMKAATNPKKTKKIKEFYKEKMVVFLEELAVPFREGNYDKIDCKITESGSDGPRALLAYQFAILHTIAEFSTSTFCPIVIDSPKQQDQDEENWTKITNFINTRRPDQSQLILALVDDAGTDFNGLVYEFTDERKVMRASKYSTAAERVEPMFSALLSARARN